MAIAKIILNQDTQIDLTQDTTDAQYTLQGYTGHKKDGTTFTGNIPIKTSSDIYGLYDYGEYTVNVPRGFYNQEYYKSVPNGSEGTPTATKGTVSNHSITVTPSVTNTEGYILGGSKTGTAVSVSASELVSGSQTITTNNTYDVTNLAQVVVNVASTGKAIQVNSDAASVHYNGYTDTGLSLTVAKAGTYNVSWTAWRSSSTGTMGTNLHVNANSGTNQQTWTNTYGQHIVLNNQTYAKDDVLTLYATSGNTSRYCWVSNLIIEEQ